jgi:hypothetical protein
VISEHAFDSFRQNFSGSLIKDRRISSLTFSIWVIGLKLMGIRIKTRRTETAARMMETVPAWREEFTVLAYFSC